MNEGWCKVQFIGGPLDGEAEVHPAMNIKLSVQGDNNGYYWMLPDGAYHWVLYDRD